MDLRIDIGDGFYLSPPTAQDIPALVFYFNDDKSITDGTLSIPYPYAEADAQSFLAFCEKQCASFGHHLILVIRNAAGELIGVIGFQGKNTIPGIAHKDEFGYWIAAQYRGKGVMQKAILALVKYGEDVRGLKRFEAPIFSFNTASERVLLKCGFKEEGYHPKAYFKNGKFIDARMFALVK